jgi:hypothetical protein
LADLPLRTASKRAIISGDRRVGVENGFRGTSVPELMGDHIEADSGSGNVVATVAGFDILIGRHYKIHFQFPAAGS